MPRPNRVVFLIAALAVVGCSEAALSPDSSPSPCELDAASCVGGPVCGNNVIETGEMCDGTDFSGEDCQSLGFVRGMLRCDNCRRVLTSGCTGAGSDAGLMFPDSAASFDAAFSDTGQLSDAGVGDTGPCDAGNGDVDNCRDR